MKPLLIGTRGSPLAMWQAEHVAAAIAECGGPQTEIVTIQTTGDRLSRAEISESGGKRLFVKEIEEALVNGRIDLAVHSAKDLPAERLPALTISAALPREDPRDAVIARHPIRTGVDVTPPTAILSPKSYRPRIGTGSIRRTAQLRHAFPNIDVAPIRGNIGTRLGKLDNGEFDLLVLATAGLVRLQLANRITWRIPFDLCLPAPGQGIVVGEYRTEDSATGNLLASLADRETAAALEAERALVTALGADCQVPLGAIACPTNDDLVLRVVVASPDGAQVMTRKAQAPQNKATELGTNVAQLLIADGAEKLLRTARPIDR